MAAVPLDLTCCHALLHPLPISVTTGHPAEEGIVMARCVGASLVALALAGCLSVEKAVVFQPSRYPDGDWQPGRLVHEDAWFQAADGVRLHGWFCPADRPRAVLLYCHGNAGNVASCTPLLRLLTEGLGVSVLLFDYRGYGRSEGTPSEEGVLADARAARRWLARRAGVAERDIVLLGRSLGGGVAVDLAARDGARGLILENTFSSLPDLAAEHFPILPVRLLAPMRLDSLAKIRAYHGPLLQTHGDADRTIPFHLAEKLFAAANPPKRFVRAPGGDHNDFPTREYCRALDAFLSSLPRRGSAPAERMRPVTSAAKAAGECQGRFAPPLDPP